MPISTPKAELGGTIVDCLLYGLYFSFFARSVHVLARKATYSYTIIYLILTTAALFCLIPAHLGLDIDRTFRAFTGQMATPNYPVGYFNILSGAEALAKNSAYVTATLIADSFMIFRCFIAVGNSYLITALPALLYIGNLISACLALVEFKRAEDPSGGAKVVAEVISRVKYMYVCTLILNVWCTASIAIKIWLVQRKSPTQGTARQALTNIITIIVESAALYSAFLIILITSASLESAMMYAVLNPMPSIIGVVFSAIIVRVGSNRAFSTVKPASTRIGFQTQSQNERISALRFGTMGSTTDDTSSSVHPAGNTEPKALEEGVLEK